MYGSYYRSERLGTRVFLVLGAVSVLIVLAAILVLVGGFFVFLFGMCAAATAGTLLIWRLLD